MQHYIEKYFFIFFFVIIALFYGNTVLNGFVHDDILDIQQNLYLQSWEHFPKIFTTCIDTYLLVDCQKLGYYYRPIGSLSYFLDFRISAQPWIFHLTNLIYLYVISLLLYALLKKLLRRSDTAFFGVIFFLCHPLISETVN